MGYIIRLFDNLQSLRVSGMNIGFRNPQRNNPCRIVPNLVNNAQTAGSLNAWSAWVQLTAGEANDYITAVAYISWIASLSDVMHFQIGSGAIGAEVPFIEFEDGTTISGTGSTPVPGHTRELPFVHIPAGTRLAVRTYDESAGPGTGGAGIYLGLLPFGNALTWDTWDDRYALGTRATGRTRIPAVGSPWINLPNGSPGAWQQIVASAAQEQLIISVQRSNANNPHPSQYDIGIGAAGSEVVQDSIGDPVVGGVVGTWPSMELSRPIRVHQGERIAMRQTFGPSASLVSMTLENIIA